MDFKNRIIEDMLRKAYGYLEKDPDKNMPKLMDLVDKTMPENTFKNQRNFLRNILNDPDSNWYRLVKSLWTDIDAGVRKTIFENFIINANFKWKLICLAAQEKYGCSSPWAILMDPTSACNLHCTGCWAAEYGNKLNMSLETLESIISQGEELGIYFYIYSGGEPLVRKKDIIKLCEMHPECEFLAFTNGTLINEEFCDEMLRVKNFIPAISVEGFEEATDFRRGEGTFKRVEKAMRLLHEKRLPFGASCCYTSKNVDEIGSEEYFDWMVEMGVKFCWFFTYIPVGNSAVPELMASAEQREFMYNAIRSFRKTKPVFTLDFWNDGEYVNGCIAGGRYYLHINANGDIEPCAFIHYSDSNIYDKTLLEALQSPLFMAYHRGQPFNKNHLRPCPLLDNPECLRRMVNESGAHSTDLESPEDVEHLTAKCEEKAHLWAETADRLWNCSHNCDKRNENNEKSSK